MIMVPLGTAYLFCVLALAPSPVAIGTVQQLPAVLSEGDQSVFEIKLRNDTAEQMDITSIKGSCGCLRLQSDGSKTERLNPGQIWNVRLKIETQGRSGPLNHSLIVEWKSTGGNGATHLEQIPVRSKIIPNIVLNYSDLGTANEIEQNKSSVKTIHFSLHCSEGPIKADSSNGLVRVSGLTAMGNKNSYELTLELASGKLGEFGDTLVIKDSRYLYRFPIMWIVHGPNFNKYAINLGLLKRGDSRSVDLSVIYGAPFEIELITSTAAQHVDWKIVNDSVEKKALSIKLTNVSMVDNLTGTISFLIRDLITKQLKTLSLPVYGLLY